MVTVIGKYERGSGRRGFVGPDGQIYVIPEDEYSEEDEDGSIGSGVVIDKNGLVLTNSHVLEGADKVIVRFSDGQEFDAEDIRRDELSDVALLRIRNPPALQPAPLGDSSRLEIGDWVIAIGSPFELEATVSAGIISGKGRGISKIQRGKLLQTDAAINPGNSGGPLVNLDGEVIGINTAIASSSGGYQGIGFAIPINNAKWVIPQLLERGRVERSYLGVGIEDLTAREAIKLGIPTGRGVLVTKVNPDSPAALAGLEEEDVIVEFAGARIRDARDLQAAVETKTVGSQHDMRIIRNGQAVVRKVMLTELPDNSR